MTSASGIQLILFFFYYRRGSFCKENSVARQRWSKLANTIKKVRKEIEEEPIQQSFRFPAFEVVDIKPDIAPQNAMDRLWFRVNSLDFKSIDLKVNFVNNQ